MGQAFEPASDLERLLHVRFCPDAKIRGNNRARCEAPQASCFYLRFVLIVSGCPHLNLQTLVRANKNFKVLLTPCIQIYTFFLHYRGIM
jgi:hypothetical protein